MNRYPEAAIQQKIVVRIVVPKKKDAMIFSYYNCCTKNVKVVFILPEGVKEHIPWLCPRIPWITSSQKVDKSCKTSDEDLDLFNNTHNPATWMARMKPWKQTIFMTASRRMCLLLFTGFSSSISPNLSSPSSQNISKKTRTKQTEAVAHCIQYLLAYLDFYLYLITFLILYLHMHIYSETYICILYYEQFIIMNSEYISKTLFSLLFNFTCDWNTRLYHIFITVLKDQTLLEIHHFYWKINEQGQNNFMV